MRAEILEALVQAALDVLHHDVSDADVEQYEREVLRRRFSAVLAPAVSNSDTKRNRSD